jgi:hypothetical protein
MRILLLIWLATTPCPETSEWAARLKAGARAGPGELPLLEHELESQVGRLLPRSTDLETRPQRLAAALNSRCGWAPESPAPPDREKLREILSRSEFVLHRSEGDFGLGDQLAGWLRQLLERLFETRGMRGFAQGTRFFVLLLALLILGLGLRRLATRFRRGAERVPAAGRWEKTLLLESPEAHLKAAESLLSADPRAATREGLLALLSLFERNRYAQPDRVKTNAEIAQELLSRGAGPALCAEAGELLRWYDRTFYSLAPVARPEAADFLGAVERLRSSLEGRA